MSANKHSGTSRRSMIVRPRRRRVGTAGAAYSHVLAMTESLETARELAVSALRRGAGSRSGVLAHARHLTQQTAAVTDDGAMPAPADLKELAGRLGRTRPLVERQIVDFELRYGLDHGTFSRVLGVTARRARARSAEVSEAWAASLDPAMMASLGPGACATLGLLLKEHGIHRSSNFTGGDEALAFTGTDGPAGDAVGAGPVEGETPTVAHLLAVAPDVLEHVHQCELCKQRLRTMTSVRTLVGQTAPAEVPSEVGLAARHARRRVPSPLPPSVEPRRIDPRRLQSIALFAVAIAMVVLSGVAVTNAVLANDETQDDRVARLIETIPTSSILATPTVMTSDSTTASLANNSDSALTWTATTTEPWLTVSPNNGRLGPSQTVSLVIEAADSGDAEIEMVASDGSRQMIRFVD